MDYVKGIFKNRPNRFIAEVEVEGKLEIAHVPNTGRCKELLVDNAVVWLKPSDNPNRKTKFSLHFVENKGVLVSLYSQQANSIAYEAIINGKIKELSCYDFHQREKTVDNSRIDIYLANENEECYVEVKGVTLIVDGEARFPDAPTERGAKHLKELMNRHDYIANEYKAGRMSREDMDKAEDDVRERYLAFVEKVKNTEGVIWDEDNQSLEFIDMWDAYYGDTGVIAMECANRKIPVMLENVDI